ncbi:polyadenylate-binding protein 8-like isoform X2 [Henckelia pumila]|uniref:polyadenylate-binding protein 8-like isoform X2 n=1 Tax=Henckelia pumila TaxID=405737 RepID=UPI003C6DCC87
MAAQVQMQPPVQLVNAAPATGAPFVTSLYVGDLDANVTDSQLYDLFSQVGDVVSVRVCRDLTSRHSLGYGYVNYGSHQDAERAVEELNFTPLNGKPIRIMYSHRDPSTRRSGAGNIFIKNLDKEIDHKALHDTFSSFGNILSCKIVTNASGHSMGYGFVQYASDESAQKAIEKLNGMLLNGKQVYVGPFLRKQEREMSVDKTVFTNVFVKNLSESTTEEDLRKIFGEFGSLTSTVVMRNEDGKSKGFGFVNFENADDAARAVESLNGHKFDNKEWYVGRAQKKSEREVELKQQFEQTTQEAVDKYQGLNLYVKNLDDSVVDDKLKELFSPFGSITSCKVMRDPKGTSRGSGFVAFSSPEEASKALSEMNGKMIAGKPLYVALAQRKEERRARLQHGFGYQQQLVPGMRPGAPLMPNMFVPLVQQGHQGPRPGGRRVNAIPMQQGPQPIMQQQMLPRGRGFRYPFGRGMPDVSMQGMPGNMLPVPYEMGGLPLHNAGISQPIPIGALASALANASPIEQRTMLGENLYPLVEQLEPDTAAKVTGMLLEMDQTEVLHLLESPEALKAKVAEAMDVLRNVSQQQSSNPADQLASLSLNE